MKIYDTVKYNGEIYTLLALVADCNEKRTVSCTLGQPFGYSGFKPIISNVKIEYVSEVNGNE